jgi:transposase
MRPPAQIELWLDTEDLQTWVREAPDKASYQRRLAIWLTHVGHLAAHQVAELLCASKQAVWLWISQYNQQGLEGLQRQGRGGRRWEYLSAEEEEAFLRHWLPRAAQGELLTAKQVRGELEKRLARRVSLGYVYGLLHRSGWRKLGPRPRHRKAHPRPRALQKKLPQVLETVLRQLPPGTRLRLLFQDEARFGCGLLVDIKADIGLVEERMLAKLEDIDTSVGLVAGELARRNSDPPANGHGS